VGASGAICGVLGALVAFLVVHRRSIPAAVGRPLGLNLVGIVVFMAILRFVVRNIDHEAHVGGVVTGFVGGLLLTRPWPVKRGHRAVARRVMASVAIVLALVGTTAAVTRRGESALPPLRRYQDLAQQLGPAIVEYESIVEGMPGTLVLSRDRDEPPARANHVRLLGSLTERARANVVQLHSASTPDPALRVMIGYLVNAQLAQIEALQAAVAYLETGKRDLLQGERGVLDRRVAANREIQAFNEHKNKYLNERAAAPAPAAPKAAPAQGRSS
jgi:rhomboid protease GluP